MNKGRHKELILISVTVNGAGVANYKAVATSDNADVTKTIKVATGASVAWYVRLNTNSGPQYPPYSVNFSDASFLGRASLNVPGGGVSPYQQVRSLDGGVKYTVTVPGLTPVFDPEMQTENGPGGDILMDPQLGVPTTPVFVVTWDVSHNTVAYTKKSYPGHPPIMPALGDTVQFQIANAPMGTEFSVVFPNNGSNPTTWASPFFLGGTGRYPGTGASTAVLVVNDDVDAAGTISPFVFQGSANGTSLTPPNPFPISLPGPSQVLAIE